MKVSKFLATLALFLTVTALLLGLKFEFDQVVYAEFNGFLDKIESETNLPTYTDEVHGQAIQKQGVSNITSAFFFVIDFFKLLLGSIAVIMVIIAGFKLILARKKTDEVWPKQKEHLIMIVAAFAIVFIADILVKKVFFGIEGEVYDTTVSAQQAATFGTAEVKTFYNIAMYAAGAMGVVMLVVAGFRLLTSGGNEEVQTKVKKQITWLVIGLFIIGIAEFVVQDFLFPIKGESIPAAQRGIALLVQFTNFISGFISLGAFLSSLYGGFLYVTATGNEEKTGKAKKVLFGSILALVIGVGAFAVVNTVIQLKPGV